LTGDHINIIDFLELGTLLPKRALSLPISKVSGSRVLLTGASGLIGINILALLLEIQRQSKTEFELTTTANSPLPLFLPENQLFKNHKIINLASKVDLSTLGKFDFIIHSGGSAQPRDFMTKKNETFIINSYVTKELLDLLNPGGHFVFMSSTELYAGLQKELFAESDIGSSSPTHPRACYIEGKRAGEMFVHWKIADGFKASSVRLSFTYGPGTKPNDLRVINELIKDSITRGEVKLRDNGMAVRSNLFSIDAAHMILQILLSPNRAVYNVASTEMCTINDIAKEVALIGNLQFKEQTSGEQINLAAQDRVAIDTTAYFEDFPSFENCSLREGLAITYSWQRKNLYRQTHNQIWRRRRK
jgi:UDP-glucuronate decarboxylase